MIQHDAIIQERKIICIGYKWEYENKTTVLRWDDNQDDEKMLREFVRVANSADELIAHFGDRFDLPWFRTRCLILGLDPLPTYKTIDTKAWASKNFYFNSNKLDYIGNVLGFGKKIKTDFDLWKDIVLHRCPKALDRMCRYCGRDVELLEKVYHKLAENVKPKSHQGVFAGLDKWTCPRCGSEDVKMNKKRVTANGTIQYQFQCQKDGGYYTVSKTAYEQYLEAKKK